MGMYSTATAVASFVIETMDGFTSDNCSVSDERVFSYIQETPMTEYKCCIVTPDTDDFLKAEMGGALYAIKGSINGFFMIRDEDYLTPQTAAYNFIDTLRAQIIANPRLNSAVMRARILSAGPLLTYQRGNYYYFIASLTYEVLENM